MQFAFHSQADLSISSKPPCTFVQTPLGLDEID